MYFFIFCFLLLILLACGITHREQIGAKWRAGLWFLALMVFPPAAWYHSALLLYIRLLGRSVPSGGFGGVVFGLGAVSIGFLGLFAVMGAAARDRRLLTAVWI
jgi:hypothetical protein